MLRRYHRIVAGADICGEDGTGMTALGQPVSSVVGQWRRLTRIFAGMVRFLESRTRTPESLSRCASDDGWCGRRVAVMSYRVG